MLFYFTRFCFRVMRRIHEAIAAAIVAAATAYFYYSLYCSNKIFHYSELFVSRLQMEHIR